MDDNAYPEIIWCFYDKIPQVRTRLLELLRPGIDRARVSLYSGVDCHSFMPQLQVAWSKFESSPASNRSRPLRPDVEIKPYADVVPNTSETKLFSATSGTRPLLANAEEDRPPVVDFLVGRGEDLRELEEGSYRIAFITGIGGQGKSALAANFFAGDAALVSFDHRLWRDCKEQSEKFEEHLVYLIEALNDGRVMSGELAKQPIENLTEMFCTLTLDLRILVIFDNVDHYIDLEARVPTGAAGNFVNHFLINRSSAKLLFTCRPAITHSDPSIFIKRLAGLDLSAAKRLFNLRRASASDASLSKAHEVTSGHALWLDLLAAQVAQRIPPIALDDLLKNISAGSGEIPDATLRSIWQSLRDREKIVLQALAETLRPTSSLQLSSYLQGRVNYKNMNKSLRVLRDLNLLVTKQLDDELGYELHPVIRAFIHQTFKRADRVWFIEAILTIYSAFFGVHQDELKRRPASGTVRRWLEGAELCINAGRYDEALSRLNEVSAAIRRSEHPGEFVRVTQILFASMYKNDFSKDKYFDAVFTVYHRFLVNLGRIDDAVEAVEFYRTTLDGKNSRYINYCDMQTYMYWRTGDFVTAIKWGKEGVDLKIDSGVDTAFNSEHNLALAQRDSGAIDSALNVFLKSSDIESVLDPSIIDRDRGGAFYGNIGRCFHLMGQIDSALVCYAKSAKIIEGEHEDGDLENKAYIRQWTGELLLLKNETSSAAYFLVASLEKWRLISPPKAERLMRLVKERWPNEDLPTSSRAETFALRWIASGGQS